ncbi:MAG: hypothetical protein IJ877_06855 [Candidatus Gastranaerophilales bacterium]|nr:hypothetical protein [Candidatus Gastranaerophilales bacterium]
MGFSIITKRGEIDFSDKELVTIGSKEGFDVKLDVDFDCMLTLQYDKQKNKCIILNQLNNKNFLFKGAILPQSIETDKVLKIMVQNSDEFITVKVDEALNYSKSEALNEKDFKTLYGENASSNLKMKIEQQKDEIEAARIAITKETSFHINDLTKKININTNSTFTLHIALLFASLLCAFGVANYLTGLPLEEAQNIIQMPLNLKLILMYMVIIYGVGLNLKQGVYLYLKNKDQNIKGQESFMIITSSIFYASIYIINVLYYMTPKSMNIFAVLISLFFILCAIALAYGCGYFKYSSIVLQNELYKYEYRPDFERVIKEYQRWIEHYVNNLSSVKIRNLKDKQFTIQLKSIGEITLGILTAPFLAYGVSNTLAMCFPEAAGWIRVSGLRFSPIFLVLASVMIIFAFFAFASAFTNIRKIQASNVLKKDGFSNYLEHGVEFLGLEATRRLNLDKNRSLIIGCTIIFIEFSMNVSYFMQEMGGDLGAMFLSALAALVPTAILIAETYMLSNKNFENSVCDSIISKLDKD